MNKTVEHRAFEELTAVAKLKQLAKAPVDLTSSKILTPERLERYQAAAVGFKLLYGTERVDDLTLEALFELARESKALDKMASMQAGEIVNIIHGHPSEQRPALHTATRDFFGDENRHQAARAAAKEAFAEVEKLKSFISEIDKENSFDQLVVVGIGGSELGPRAHYEALQYLQKSHREAFFLGNVDPDALGLLLPKLKLDRCLVVVISKTGTTLETKTNETLLRGHFAANGLDSRNHFVSVTCAGSPLDDDKQYRQVFKMWEWVGGRYSTTSMAGGVLLAFAFGFDVFYEFLKGASAMDKIALSSDLKENIPLLAALLGIWNRTFLNHPVVAVIPYCQPLARFPAHLQQLDMESNGKHIDQQGHPVTYSTGPILFGEPGTNAQHSFYQSIHQGTTVIPLEMIGFKHPQMAADTEIDGTDSQQKLLSNLFAQALALASGQESDNPNKQFVGNRPSWLLLGSRLTPYALGALLAFYEHKVAFQGFIWQINSFDQEGVQLGKVLASRILNGFAKSASGKEYPLGETLIRQLDSL